MQHLDVTLTLDRREYFSGEDATLSIVVKNSTNQAIEILQPFLRRTGWLMYQARTPGGPMGDWTDLSPIEGTLDMDAPTQYLGPGEELRREWVLSAASNDEVARNAYRLPEREGDYRLIYLYTPKASAAFKVVSPTIGSWSLVPLQRRDTVHYIDPDGKERLPVQILERRVAVMVLSYQDKHVIAVSRIPLEGPAPRDVELGAPLTRSGAHEFSPYFRIVETSDPITSLQAEADASETITISYADTAGRRTIKLDAERHVTQQ
jgi:hypothetical protein